MKPTFIRAFWGDLDHHDGRHRKEIENTAKGERLNELVYVWGKENEEFIKSFGFRTKLVYDKPFEYGQDYLHESRWFFFHKIMAIKYGIQSNRAGVVFLDWDMVQQKPIDLEFYKQLKNKFYVPLYSFPITYKDIVLNEWEDISDKDREYVIKQHDVLSRYHYIFNNNFVVPNTSFVYCRDIKIIDEIIKFNIGASIKIISDETPFMYYFLKKGIDLETYIKEYEPTVSDAKFETHFNQKYLNRYISKFIKKDLYFIHE